MTAEPSPYLDRLPAELIASIAEHLRRPRDLLAVALTCRRLERVIVPDFLYRDIRVRRTAELVDLLGKLERRRGGNKEAAEGTDRGSAPVGTVVRRLRVTGLVFTDPRYSECRDALLRLIDQGALSRLVSLSLDHFIEDVCSPKQWRLLREKCPELKEVDVGAWDDTRDRWFEKSGLFDCEGLEGISIRGWERYEHRVQGGPMPDLSRLYSNISCDKIRILRIHFANEGTYGTADYLDVFAPGGLLSLRLPNLRVLSLNGFKGNIETNDRKRAEQTKEFWNSLERLEVLDFGDNSDLSDLLRHTGKNPFRSLRRFVGEVDDARRVMRTTTNLVRLDLVVSLNAQAIELLRNAPFGEHGEPLGFGLPSLRSLGIVVRSQEIGERDGEAYRDPEEEPSGRGDMLWPHGGSRQVDVSFLRSIARACPHLEELELSGRVHDVDGALSIRTFASALGKGNFPWLRSLYLEGALTFPDVPRTRVAQVFSDSCPSLEAVGFERDFMTSAVDGVRIFIDRTVSFVEEPIGPRAICVDDDDGAWWG